MPRVRPGGCIIKPFSRTSHANLGSLTGQPQPVEALGQQIAAYAAGTLNRPLTTYPVYALFEDYGALPIVVCVYDDFSVDPGNDHRFFVLIDGVNEYPDPPTTYDHSKKGRNNRNCKSASGGAKCSGVKMVVGPDGKPIHEKYYCQCSVSGVPPVLPDSSCNCHEHFWKP